MWESYAVNHALQRLGSCSVSPSVTTVSSEGNWVQCFQNKILKIITKKPPHTSQRVALRCKAPSHKNWWDFRVPGGLKGIESFLVWGKKCTTSGYEIQKMLIVLKEQSDYLECACLLLYSTISTFHWSRVGGEMLWMDLWTNTAALSPWQLPFWSSSILSGTTKITTSSPLSCTPFL